VSAPDTLNLANTRALWQRASKVMPGGVNASARMNGALGHPLFFQRGEGAYLYDVDGNRYIDCCNSHGASLLGHGHAGVAQAAQRTLAQGGLLACETELQVEVAERLLAYFPGMDMMRYTCSGTETTWLALRVARAFSGRYDVIKFEGHYHGVNDVVGYSHWPDLAKAGPPDHPNAVPDSAGIPPENDDRIILLPFNDADTFERAVRAKADTLAAVIMEPVSFDSCGLVPTPEFLDCVRRLTQELGIVLIFDEILTGFRKRPGGILGDACIPDMTILGKAVGGGMPISVFLGRREIMETCTPVGPALHSGTYNAPPALVAGMGAFLDDVAHPDFYPRLLATGERLYTGMRDIIARAGVHAWVQGIGARFGLIFGIEEEPRSYRDIAGQDMEMMARFHRACLARGVYLHYVSPHHGYSAAHTESDIDETLNVMEDALFEIRTPVA
jgi:glutamate-1-semialdehyde 2,1-aminomutase